MSFLDNVKNISNSFIAGVKKTSNLIMINNDISKLKKRMLNTYIYNQLRTLARLHGISDQKDTKKFDGYNKGKSDNSFIEKSQTIYYPRYKNIKINKSFSDFVNDLKYKVKIEEVIDFAEQNNNRLIYKLKEEYLSLLEKKEVIKNGKQSFNSKKELIFFDVVKEIKNCISNIKKHKEINYQYLLYGRLQYKFPQVKLEEQINSSRPDIVINKIGIEIKGPTGNRELQTIADKLLRYPQYFKDGIILVLFDVYAHPRRYAEWERGLKREYPDVVIIRK